MTLPITIPQIEELVATCSEEATGWRTIILPTTGIKPANQYITIFRRNREVQQHEEITEKEDSLGNFSEEQKGESYFDFEIIAYGEDASQKIDSIVKYINSSNRNIAPGQINPNNIFAGSPLWSFLGLGGIGDQQDVSVEFAGKIQKREMININFYAMISSSESAEYFNAVDIAVKKDNNIYNLKIKGDQ